MSVDDYFNGMLELLSRCNSTLNEVEASGLLLRNMRPGLAKSIRRLHPCEEWTVANLRSHALRHQAEYDSRMLEEKKKVKNTNSREFINTNRGGRGGFQRRPFQRGGFSRFAYDSGPRSDTNAGESSPLAIGGDSKADNSQGTRSDQRTFQRPFDNYRRRNNNYRGNFRGGFDRYRGNGRGGLKTASANYPPIIEASMHPKAREHTGPWTNDYKFDHEAYYKFLKDLRPNE